jgi:hypothetical protein
MIESMSTGTFRLSRKHIYPCDLEITNGITTLSAGFHKDPRFRSQEAILEDRQAPFGNSVVTKKRQSTPTLPTTPAHSISSIIPVTATPATITPALKKARFHDIAESDTTMRYERRQSLSSTAESPVLTASELIQKNDKKSLKAKAKAYIEAYEALEKKFARVVEEKKLLLLSVDILTQENKLLLKKMDEMAKNSKLRGTVNILNIDTMLADESIPLKSFTGFDTPEQVKGLYNLLNKNGACTRLKYWGMEKGSSRKKKRRHRKMKLTPDNAFAMTLVALRTGAHLKVVGYLFGVSESVATRYFTTWVMALNYFFRVEFPYPTKDELQDTTKDRLRQAFNIPRSHFEAMIDCHEQQLEAASDLTASRETWSEYKQRPTLKFFGAITGNGAFSFVSEAYRGRTTDVQVTRLCGFLDLIHPGGLTGADKGFQMQSDFTAKQASLIIPPVAVAGQDHFGRDQMADTSIIARERIHVERAFRRAQEFQILHRVIPITMIDMWGSIFQVCCYLTNYQPPLIKDKQID